MKRQIEAIVIDSLRDLGEEFDREELKSATAETPLFGSGGNLDSHGLVSLISEIEERIYTKFKRDVILADELAMSKARSPFKNVPNMVAYILNILNGGDHG